MEGHTLTQRLAAELRAEMSRQKRSAARMSSDLGMPLSTLNRRLSGRSPLDTDELEAVAAYLGLGAADLVIRAHSEAVA